MREPNKDLGRVKHMLEMTELLNVEKGKHTLEAVEQDPVLFFGLSKMVEIIDEAAYKITKEFKSTHPQLPWKQIEGMRHILVHGYFSVSAEVLWDVIQNDIPAMAPTLRCFSEELTKGE